MARIGIPFFDFSAVLDKLQAIADNVHPTASGTSITPTGMHIVTEDDVQGAISELDTAVDSVNSSLAQLEEAQFTAPVDLSSYTTTSNVYTCPCDGYVVANAGSASNSKSIIRIYNPSMSQYFTVGGWSNTTYQVVPCFVKKGSKLQTMTLENGGNARFYPLNG